MELDFFVNNKLDREGGKVQYSGTVFQGHRNVGQFNVLLTKQDKLPIPLHENFRITLPPETE